MQMAKPTGLNTVNGHPNKHHVVVGHCPLLHLMQLASILLPAIHGWPSPSRQFCYPFSFIGHLNLVSHSLSMRQKSTGGHHQATLK
jgi:hypothetical protein